MSAGRTVCRLQLLNRIQRNMAAQSSVVRTATLAVLACRRLERSRRVVRCRHLWDREEAASTARSPALLGAHVGYCCASCGGASIQRGAAYRPALHPRSAAHPFRRERAPQHLVRCPGIWLRSPGPYEGFGYEAARILPLTITVHLVQVVRRSGLDWIPERAINRLGTTVDIRIASPILPHRI
jgi:hypothetical protein